LCPSLTGRVVISKGQMEARSACIYSPHRSRPRRHTQSSVPGRSDRAPSKAAIKACSISGGEPPKDHALVSVVAEMLPPSAEMVRRASSRSSSGFSDLAGALSAHCDVQGRSLRPLTSTPAGRSLNLYVETLATTMRAVSGLSRQTPSLRMTKSAGSKTWPLTKSSAARSTFGRSGSIRSKMNLDDPSLPSCMMPIVGS
jgi:hypothetical protein